MLKFKHEFYDMGEGKRYTRHYTIYDKGEQIGCASFIRKNRMLYLMYVEVYDEYRHKGYGDTIVKQLMEYKNVDCIVGETLVESRGFWNKMIRKYNGKRRNVTYNDNTSSSFVIPNTKITNDELYDFFDECEEYPMRW